jgi:hypothetical protein
MKKIVVLGAFALALGLVSCNKDYTCDCHYHQEVDGMEEHLDKEIEINGAKKDEAEESCHEEEHHLEEDGYADVHCELK